MLCYAIIIIIMAHTRGGLADKSIDVALIITFKSPVSGRRWRRDARSKETEH